MIVTVRVTVIGWVGVGLTSPSLACLHAAIIDLAMRFGRSVGSCICSRVIGLVSFICSHCSMALRSSEAGSGGEAVVVCSGRAEGCAQVWPSAAITGSVMRTCKMGQSSSGG